MPTQRVAGFAVNGGTCLFVNVLLAALEKLTLEKLVFRDVVVCDDNDALGVLRVDLTLALVDADLEPHVLRTETNAKAFFRAQSLPHLREGPPVSGWATWEPGDNHADTSG